jgi:hypothetical protein
MILCTTILGHQYFCVRFTFVYKPELELTSHTVFVYSMNSVLQHCRCRVARALPKTVRLSCEKVQHAYLTCFKAKGNVVRYMQPLVVSTNSNTTDRANSTTLSYFSACPRAACMFEDELIDRPGDLAL